MGLSRIDQNLLAAWARIGRTCQRRRAEALRREARERGSEAPGAVGA